MKRRMFSKIVRPLFDGHHDGGKGVVLEHDIRRLAGDIGAALAHGDADIGLLEGGRVVHAVARHGDDSAGFLPQADQVELSVPGETRAKT